MHEEFAENGRPAPPEDAAAVEQAQAFQQSLPAQQTELYNPQFPVYDQQPATAQQPIAYQPPQQSAPSYQQEPQQPYAYQQPNTYYQQPQPNAYAPQPLQTPVSSLGCHSSSVPAESASPQQPGNAASKGRLAAKIAIALGAVIALALVAFFALSMQGQTDSGYGYTISNQRIVGTGENDIPSIVGTATNQCGRLETLMISWSLKDANGKEIAQAVTIVSDLMNNESQEFEAFIMPENSDELFGYGKDIASFEVTNVFFMKEENERLEREIEEQREELEWEREREERIQRILDSAQD